MDLLATEFIALNINSARENPGNSSSAIESDFKSAVQTPGGD